MILKRILLASLLAVVGLLAGGHTSDAQETGPEALRLPEIVITGTDQAKIQRVLPKARPFTPPPVVTQASHDQVATLLRQGDLVALTQPRQAEKPYLQALALDASHSETYLRLGALYRAQNDAAAALDAYQHALTLSADLLEAHYYLGILYESPLNNPGQAIEHYRAYLQQGGADRRAAIWLRDLERQATPQ